MAVTQEGSPSERTLVADAVVVLRRRIVHGLQGGRNGGLRGKGISQSIDLLRNAHTTAYLLG